MIAIILAAGFGTRLGIAGSTCPKGLLPVGDTNLISLLVNEVFEVCEPDQIVIVSNAKYHAQFEDWARQQFFRERLVIVNNGVHRDEDRRGAVADLEYAIVSLSITSDVFVAASDCYLTFSLREFTDFFNLNGECCVAVRPVARKDELRDGAEVVVANDHHIVRFTEKPSVATSNLGAFPLYFLTHSAILLLSSFFREGMNPDSPGRFIEWLVSRCRVLAFTVNDGDCFDLGTPDRYTDIIARFAQRDV